MESKRLLKGKVITVVGDIYYQYLNGTMSIHYTKPTDYVFLTNLKGEAKIYYPDKNEVITQQNQIFSSENDVLYEFLSNHQADMGLKELGFTMTSSKKEDKMIVTVWTPDAYNSKQVSKVELVHENYFPIYIAYFNDANRIFKKSYFSNYFTSIQTPFPTRIIDIDYLPNGDSIVNRKIYSEVRINQEANSLYFNFVIPANAKLSNFSKKTK